MNSEFLDRWAPYVLSILRIVAAILFFEHGLQKLFGIPERMGGASGPELFSLMGAAGVLELAGGALLAVGFFTRPIAFLLSGEMAFAYWMAHAPKSFIPLLNGGDAAILYCFVFLYLVFAGPGPWSIDAKTHRD
ncbi:MAG: DoxX family protein [Hyphomicrobium sp.]|uniref:DoxX family protein n=1 Tax=Hyphomicrobium sp. TaxID=82 RepID=UPI0039E46AA9